MVLISLTSPLRNVDMTGGHCDARPMVSFQAYKRDTAHRSDHKLDDPTCDLPQQANSLCHVQGEPTAAVALLYMAL